MKQRQPDFIETQEPSTGTMPIPAGPNQMDQKSWDDLLSEIFNSLPFWGKDNA